MPTAHETTPSGQPEPDKHQLEKAGKLIDDFFPNIARNYSSRHYLKLFIEDAELPPDLRDAIRAVVRNRLNGKSAEILDSGYDRGDMLLGQPVHLTRGGPKTAVQKPH